MISAKDLNWMERDELNQRLLDAGFWLDEDESDDEVRETLVLHYDTEGLLVA